MSNISLKRNITSSVARLWNKEFIVFMFLFIMSASFWVFMALNENYEREIRIPVVVENIPRNAILLDNEKDTVTLNIRANGFAFLYKTFNTIETIKIDFAKYKQDNRIVVSNSEIQKLAKQKLGKSIQILSVKSEGFSFLYSNGEHKRLPVKFMGRIGAKSDKEITISPEFVDVYAQPDILNTLKFIKTVDDSLNVEEDVTRNFMLETTRGIKCKPQQVKVNIKPIVFVENTIEVQVECINEPADKKLALFPPRVSVTYVVDIKNHNLITKEGFKVIADYNEVADMKQPKCSFKLVAQPPFVKQAKLAFDETKYLITDR